MKELKFRGQIMRKVGLKNMKVACHIKCKRDAGNNINNKLV